MAGARQLAPRRGIGLIRVSKARGREDLISPELQRAAIETHAQRKNIRITDWVEALDESGSQERSPWWRTLEAVVQRVEAGEADVVVVWKFSRMARHRRRWAITIDRIEVAGAALESATEDVDTTTSTGRLTRGMLAELAAWEADIKREGWQEVKQRRARLGLADGQPRFGYQLVGKTYRPDPVVAPILAECYQRAADGQSFRSLAVWLNAQGHLTRYGNQWQRVTVAQMLRTGFAAGLIQYKQQHLPGVHEAIINAELWEKFLSARVIEPRRVGVSDRHMLSGLLRCAYCGSPLHCYGNRNGLIFRCDRHERFHDCPRGGVSAWGPAAEQVITDWLAQRVAGQEAEYEQRLRVYEKQPKANVTLLRRQLAKIETDLLNVAQKNLDGFYDDDTYLTLRAGLLDKQRTLTKQMQEVAAGEPQPYDYRPVQRVWSGEKMTEQKRRQALLELLSHVLVRKRPDGPKYEVVPLWGN